MRIDSVVFGWGKGSGDKEGKTGATGAAGKTGATGAAGKTGAAGATGNLSAAGATGVSGAKGVAGAIGMAGWAQADVARATQKRPAIANPPTPFVRVCMTSPPLRVVQIERRMVCPV